MSYSMGSWLRGTKLQIISPTEAPHNTGTLLHVLDDGYCLYGAIQQAFILSDTTWAELMTLGPCEGDAAAITVRPLLFLEGLSHCQPHLQ